MAEHLKVKGYTGLVRDVYSSAIVREKSTDFKSKFTCSAVRSREPSRI